MKFSEVVTQTLAWLQREGRISYRAVKLEFDLNDDALDALKEEIIEAKQVASDENGKVLVWSGSYEKDERTKGRRGERAKRKWLVVSYQLPVPQHPTPNTQLLAERRQLTVLFCDLVGSTALSAQLDPEDYRAVVQRYQQTCAAVIQRYEGYIAQYLGDGLLVYFGYPTAHEDDARRAVRAGLEIITALALSSDLEPDAVGARRRRAPTDPVAKTPLQVRIGIHTGLVVIGEIGSNEKRELLALGETPNVAARIQGLAEPNTVIISAATQRLIEGQFESQPFGSHLVKGIETPITVYHVQSEREDTSPLAGRISLTPLVGREQEVGLLVDRWEQAKEGHGQVVLLSGEPGIGKSRLAYTLREHVTSEGSLLFEARCSSYHQHSALYPLIDVLQRTLLLARQDTDEEKTAKLERALALYDMHESLPLFTALLSLPTPTQHLSLNLTPQKQKERTLQALVQLWVAQAERQATVSVWEDLHWADPSSLEFLTLLIEQIPTSKLLLVLTFRPEFMPSWKPRSHISQLVLNRLGKRQAQEMVKRVVAQAIRPSTGSGRTDLEPLDPAATVRAEPVEARTAIPDSLINAVIERTDGVPLFVEELTKAVLEAEGVGAQHAVPLQTIPTTLQEALLARLDRLSTARQIAQLGATLGREFSYELLHAVASLSETDLQAALAKLVEAEILYQRGVGEQTRYFFKHALIQDTAYQSLLKSTRQQYHQQIAQILEERFPDTKTNQPELLAHHYTEAGLVEQAIPYWQQAGQRASQRSAYIEAINHVTKGLELLKLLPDTPERSQKELILQTTLGHVLTATKGWTYPGVGAAYARSLALCQHLGDSSQLSQVLFGLWAFYVEVPQFQTAHELGEQLLSLAQKTHDPFLLAEAHFTLGFTLFFHGEIASARDHLRQGIIPQVSQQGRSRAALYGFDPKVPCRSIMAFALWLLGYPDQALKSSKEAFTLAQEISHPYSSAIALHFAAAAYQCRREVPRAQEQAEELIRLCTEQGFPLFLAWGTILRGWVLAVQGEREQGIAHIQQGLTASRSTGGELRQPYWLALLAAAHGEVRQPEEVLTILAEALAVTNQTEERWYEAELYRLKGELLLNAERRMQNDERQTKEEQKETAPIHHSSFIIHRSEEAEACFLKAIDIARKQQAKSLELRASTSLARLWQQQGKKIEAHNLLSEVYNWFTEGFDTKDLQEAKALIEELSH